MRNFKSEFPADQAELRGEVDLVRIRTNLPIGLFEFRSICTVPDTPEGQRLSQAVLESAQAVVKLFEKRPKPGTPEFKELQALLQADIAVNQAYLDHLKKGMT